MRSHDLAALHPGERSQGPEEPPPAGPAAREPSAPPAWLVGDIRQIDIAGAFLELLVLMLVAALLVVILNGGA